MSIQSRRRGRKRKYLRGCAAGMMVMLAVSSLAGDHTDEFRSHMSAMFYEETMELLLPQISAGQESGSIGTGMVALLLPAVVIQEQEAAGEPVEPEIHYSKLAELENGDRRLQLAAQERKKKVDETFRQPQTEVVEPQKKKVREEKVVGKAAQKEPGTRINRKKLEDFDYLLSHFYQVDHTTTITKEQLDVRKLLNYDMRVDKDGEEPQILIYHTHSQEGYQDSKAGDPSTTVVGVGEHLTELMEGYGYKVLHDTGTYDLPERDHAYSVAAPAVEKILREHPSIQIVIDLHRDGVASDVRLVTKQNGKQMAKVMFFNGLSHTTALGDIAYLKNPYIEDNLAFSLQMQLAAAEKYPDFTRRIYLKGYRFNMHLVPRSLLVEVGAQTNTFAEAYNAMEPLADVLNTVLSVDE